MSSARRKRKAPGQEQEHTRGARQTFSKTSHETPPGRTTSTRTRSFTAPKTRQQTLTQIDFVTRSFPIEDVDLTYIKEEDEAPLAKKRRKTLPQATEPRKAVRRAQKILPQASEPPRDRRRARKTDNTRNGGNRRTDFDQGKEETQRSGARLVKSGIAEIPNPPPTTPKKIMKTEIPSSQSPADTPLSTQGHRAVREPSRSPLKSRSTNVGIVAMRPLKLENGNRRLPKLEIRDTFEMEDSSPVIAPEMPPEMGSLREDFVLENEYRFPTLICQDSNASERDKNIILPPISARRGDGTSSIQRGQQGTEKTNSHQLSQSVVQDTESEVEEDHEHDPFDTGFDTQAAFAHCLSDINRLDEDIAITDYHISKRTDNLFESSSRVQTDRTTGVSKDQATPSSIKGLSSLTSFDRSESDDPKHNAHSSPDSEYDGASVQLLADLSRQTQTQTPSLQTERPIKSRWRPSYRSPQVDDAEDEENDCDLPPLRNYHSEADRQSNVVPPSQATTVDITQESVRSSQLPQSSQAVPMHLQYPPMVFSSSPLYIWDNDSDPLQPVDSKPLTDSQLLPDSVMNFSIPRPPGWIGMDHI